MNRPSLLPSSLVLSTGTGRALAVWPEGPLGLGQSCWKWVRAMCASVDSWPKVASAFRWGSTLRADTAELLPAAPTRRPQQGI